MWFHHLDFPNVNTVPVLQGNTPSARRAHDSRLSQRSQAEDAFLPNPELARHGLLGKCRAGQESHQAIPNDESCAEV